MVGKKKRAVAAAASAAGEEAPSPAPHESKKRPRESLEAIQADVSSFAASLGLGGGAAAAASLTASSGFDDSDFRKKGPINKKEAAAAPSATGENGSGRNSGGGKKRKKSKVSSETGADDIVLTKKRESSSRPDFSDKGFDEEEDEEKEVKPKGRKKERSIKPIDEAAASASRTGAKNRDRAQNEPLQKSKIHEVLDSALVKNPKSDSNNANGGGKYLHVARPSNPITGSAVTQEAVQKLRVEAEQLLEKAAQQYERAHRKDSEAKWLMTIRRSGTSADKVAAMTVILQENPKANVRTLDALIGMLTSKAGKRHAATGIDALKELFIFNLLPDRKLKYFVQQPFAALDDSKERASTLIDWYWEDCLKHRYENYVHALEEATKDTLFFLKEKALKTVFELLKSKPEQERRLLSALVNKLGDPDRKMASNASYFLSGLLTTHPNMKKVVVDEVEAFVFRPNVGLRARYYAAIFLNQTLLSNKGDGPALAKQLIDLYFALFKVVTSVVDEGGKDTRENGGAGKKKAAGRGKPNGLVKDKEKSADFTMEIDSRLLSALLTGVNRALPYIRNEDLDSITQDNDVLFRLVHSPNFNLAVQALMLLHQLLTKSQAISDRFYRALYSVLLSKELGKSSKAEMFLGLIFKAVQSDVDSRRMSAFAKRLLQVAMHQPPQFTCGCLFLLSELLKAKPGLWDSALQSEDHDEEEHFKDVKDEADDEKVSENQGPTNADTATDVWPKPGSYDPKSREPLYCNAHRACWWELSLLAFHVHPSVAAMARTLLSGASIVYDGDPLRDLALGVFLDRFTEKKPKPLRVGQAGARQGSMLPRHPNTAQGLAARPLGEQFSALEEDQVAPEDLVFHKFYVAKSIMSKKPKQKKKKRGGDDEDDAVEDLLGEDADAVEGVGGDDDSEDEEVDALLEQEADLEMDDEDDISDEDEEGAADSDDDDISLNQEDDTADGSEVDEFDDSEDEEADGLLEAGLSISSDDDDDGGGAGEEEAFDLGKKKKKKPKRKITVDESEAINASEEDAKEMITNRASKVPKKSKVKGDVKGNRLSTKAGRKSTATAIATGTSRGRRKGLSVFQEAPPDDEF